MDPNETLKKLREWVEANWAGRSQSEKDAVELFEALDDWIVRGGLLPAAWDPFKITYAKAMAKREGSE